MGVEPAPAVDVRPLAHAVPRRRRGVRPGELLVLAVALVVAVVLIYPTVWVFFASFKTQETLFSGEFAHYTLRNYRRLFASGFGVHIGNSLVISATAVLISTFVSVIAAYVFSRRRFRWKSVIFGGVMLGQTFPWIILVTPVFILFARLGLLNTYVGIIVCYVAVTIPFSVYLLVGYLESVPRSLDEMAIIDGCPPFQVIWRIVFPIMLPGVVATATYAFILCWSEYLFALAFLTRTDMKTMPLALYAFFGEHTTEWGQVMAAAALTTLPPLLLFLPLQTKLSAGLAAGAVKQ
ncbi:MAG TPA: carbohydrate ABC transporter permease [Methylomirabilota bacterium]|nr:carbohydrate ABC transporter permease [Methylomirabilota bacterium]